MVNDDGNVIDAVLNSCVVALMDMRKPMVNVERNEVTFRLYLDWNQLKKTANAEYRSFTHLDVIFLCRKQHICGCDTFVRAGRANSNYNNDEHLQRNMFDSQARRNGTGPRYNFRHCENIGGKGQGKDIKDARNC